MQSPADFSPAGDPTTARNLFLMRHGPAEDSIVSTDANRALTPWGEELVRDAARVLGRRGCRPSVILSSPYRRARETAEALLEILLPPSGVRIVDRLASGASPETILHVALDALAAGDALLVGHNPEMDGAVRRLAAGHESDLGPMRPGSVAWFACPPPDFRSARLEGFWTAEDLQAEGA
jgi:phosphohistidine phosphatase